MANVLRLTQVRKLDEFIKDHLLPDNAFLTEVRADVDFICAFLKERCFQDAAHSVRVSRVVMGGSYDEHTALKGRSEANMVVFLNNLTSFEEQLRRREEFMEEIREHLCQLQQEEQFNMKLEVRSSEQPDARSLSFKLSYPQLQQEVEFDVQPAYDVLYELRNLQHFDSSNYSKIYAQLVHECTILGKEGEFSICFTDLQHNFLRLRAPKLWNLIRLVKHWYQLCEEKLRKPLPPRYAVELLMVYAWECGAQDSSGLHTAQCFRTVLELITKYRHLRIYWTWCYDFKDKEVSVYLHRQLQKDSPVILDPADPTRNVAGSDLQAWELLGEEAVTWLESSFFKNSDMFHVRPWDVPPEKQGCTIL